MKNAEPKNEGTVSGRIVSYQPKVANILKTGIIVTCAGSIIVESRTINRKFLPGKRILANPNATSEQDSICPNMDKAVIRQVLNV